MQKKERKVWKKNGQVSSREKKRKKERKIKRINDSPCSLTNIFQVQKIDSFQGAK
jgi:hypothetical protein